MIPRRPLLCSTCKSSQQRAEALSVSSACPLDLLPLIEASVDSYLVPNHRPHQQNAGSRQQLRLRQYSRLKADGEVLCNLGSYPVLAYPITERLLDLTTLDSVLLDMPPPPSASQREECLIDEVANLREGLLAEFHAR
jgi:hypothetical protein